MHELSTTKGIVFHHDPLQSSGMLFLGIMLDDFLSCPCSSSLQHCSDLMNMGDHKTDHSLSLKEEPPTNRG